MLAAVNFVEEHLDFGRAIVFGIKLLDAVVRQPTAYCSKEVVAHLQCGNQIGKLADFHARNFGKTVDVCPIGSRVFSRHSLVGAPGRQHLDFEAVVANLYMVFERVYGVVGGAYYLHIIV